MEDLKYIEVDEKLLTDVYSEIVDELELDINIVKVFIVETNDYEDYPYSVYVKTEDMDEPSYWGDELGKDFAETYIKVKEKN